MSRPRLGDFKPALEAQEGHNRFHPFPYFHVREHEGTALAHHEGVRRHDLERGADVRREIDLVDHEQVRARYARAAFARYFLAARDVDDVDREIRELGGEGRRKVVTPRFDEDQIEVDEALAHFGNCREIDRGVLADRGMRTAAGLDAHDPLRRKRARLDQNAGVLLGVDVVGDGGDIELVAQALAKLLHQRRLAGTDGPADADAKRLLAAHDRNNLEYC